MPTPAAGTQLVIEYEAPTRRQRLPPTAWYAALGSMPKARWLLLGVVVFIRSASAGPTLDTISIVSKNRTTGKSADKWLEWPGNAFGAPWPWTRPSRLRHALGQVRPDGQLGVPAEWTDHGRQGATTS